MVVPNITPAILKASIPDKLPQLFVAPNFFFSIPFMLSLIIMKETALDLIKKILYLIISRLTEIIFCFHRTQTLKNAIKISLKSLILYLKLIHL